MDSTSTSAFFGKPVQRGPKSITPGWGIFGRASIADGGTGNPNYVGWTASLGVGGDSALRRGRGDRFGLGYIYASTTTEWGPLARALFGPRDSQAVEMYYKFQMTPSISVTPDVQWVRGQLGGLTSGNDAFIYGMRMNVLL